MNLSSVEQFEVSVEVIRETEHQLRGAGAKGHELFVLWPGVLSGSLFRIVTTYVPPQTSTRSPDGCSVRVNASALSDLNRWLFEHGQVLGVQVHSHPSEAFHSQTDDAYPIVTMLGGLSIVAANFGRDGIASASTAAYRLTRRGWERTGSIVRITGIA